MIKTYKGLIKIDCNLPECLFGKTMIDPECANCDQCKIVIVGLDGKELVEIETLTLGEIAGEEEE